MLYQWQFLGGLASLFQQVFLTSSATTAKPRSRAHRRVLLQLPRLSARRLVCSARSSITSMIRPISSARCPSTLMIFSPKTEWPCWCGSVRQWSFPSLDAKRRLPSRERLRIQAGFRKCPDFSCDGSNHLIDRSGCFRHAGLPATWVFSQTFCTLMLISCIVLVTSSIAEDACTLTFRGFIRGSSHLVRPGRDLSRRIARRTNNFCNRETSAGRRCPACRA